MSQTVFAGDILLVALALEAPAILDNARSDSRVSYVTVDGNGAVYGYAVYPNHKGRTCTWGPASGAADFIEIKLGWPDFLKRLEPLRYHKDWREMIAELPR